MIIITTVLEINVHAQNFSASPRNRRDGNQVLRKCGISNALDGSEDSLMIEEGDGEEKDEGHFIITLEDNKENEDF